jgi:hypothetical protein
VPAFIHKSPSILAIGGLFVFPFASLPFRDGSILGSAFLEVS